MSRWAVVVTVAVVVIVVAVVVVVAAVVVVVVATAAAVAVAVVVVVVHMLFTIENQTKSSARLMRFKVAHAEIKMSVKVVIFACNLFIHVQIALSQKKNWGAFGQITTI